jgi:hypothetical protein
VKTPVLINPGKRIFLRFLKGGKKACRTVIFFKRLSAEIARSNGLKDPELLKADQLILIYFLIFRL